MMRTMASSAFTTSLMVLISASCILRLLEVLPNLPPHKLKHTYRQKADAHFDQPVGDGMPEKIFDPASDKHAATSFRSYRLPRYFSCSHINLRASISDALFSSGLLSPPGSPQST